MSLTKCVLFPYIKTVSGVATQNSIFCPNCLSSSATHKSQGCQWLLKVNQYILKIHEHIPLTYFFSSKILIMSTVNDFTLYKVKMIFSFKNYIQYCLFSNKIDWIVVCQNMNTKKIIVVLTRLKKQTMLDLLPLP